MFVPDSTFQPIFYIKYLNETENDKLLIKHNIYKCCNNRPKDNSANRQLVKKVEVYADNAWVNGRLMQGLDSNISSLKITINLQCSPWLG